MIQTNKLLPILTGIKKDKKLINESQPQLKLPSKKEIVISEYGQHLFPGKITGIKGGNLNTSGDYVTPLTGEGILHNLVTVNPYGANVLQRGQQSKDQPGNFQLEIPMAQFGGGQEDQISQLIAAYAQLSGLDPQEIIQKLQSLPQDQQQQALQSIAQEVQQAMAQQQQAGPDQQMGMAEMGGEPCFGCYDNYNPSPQAQNLEWFYKKAKGGLIKYQGDKGKSQVGKPKLGDFQVGLGKFDADQFRKNVISTQPAATGSGTSVPYNMEEDLRMQQEAAQKMAAYHNNDRAFDSTYFANSIPQTMQNMVEGTEIIYPIQGTNKKRHTHFSGYPADYFQTQEEMINRYPKFENEGGYDKNGNNMRYLFNPDERDHGPYNIPLNIFRNVRDQRNPQEIRQGQQAAYDAWQKGDKLTKSYLTDDQINQLAQRMASGQNFSDISYEEMLSVPDLKKVQEAAAKLGKKAKGGTAYMMDDLYRNGGLKKFAPGGPDKPVGGKASFYQGQDEYEDSANQSSSASASPSLASYNYNYGNYTNPYELATPNFMPSGMNQDMYTINPADYQAQLIQSMGTRQALENALQRSAQSAKAATQPSTSPVVKPEETSTPVDDSKWFSNSDARKNYFELGINPKANVKMRPDENTFQNQSLAVPINVGFGNNRWGVNVTGGLNFDKSIANPATVISSDAASPSTSPVRMTTTPITFGATRKGTNSTLGITGGYSPDKGDFNVGANYTLKFGKKPEQRNGGNIYQDGRQTGNQGTVRDNTNTQPINFQTYNLPHTGGDLFMGYNNAPTRYLAPTHYLGSPIWLQNINPSGLFEETYNKVTYPGDTLTDNQLQYIARNNVRVNKNNELEYDVDRGKNSHASGHVHYKMSEKDLKKLQDIKNQMTILDIIKSNLSTGSHSLPFAIYPNNGSVNIVKSRGGEAFPQANEYQAGRQTGKKTPNYEPNWFARRTSVPGQVLGAVANTLPYFGSIMGKGVYDMAFNGGKPAYVPNTDVTYDDLSYYMMNRRYLNQDANPKYDKIIQNLTPEELEQISGPMFKGGGEAFPQAQTYLPYMRRGETRPNFMFKNGGQKKAGFEEYQKKLLIDLLNNQ